MTLVQHSMMDVAPTVSAILRLPPPAQAKGRAIQEIASDFADMRKLAILAPDAFGDFAWRLWQKEMPFLKSLHAKRSILLRSVMPSITPVNFATMVTGTDLAGHGINTFNDNFKCETLFDVVRKAGLKSAGIGIEGYTGQKLLARSADIPGNAGNGTDDDVAKKVMEIASAHGPAFLIAQLGRVDDVFHKHGPSSPQVVPMLRETDGRLRRLVAGLKPLGYAVIILADHGQHDTVFVPLWRKNAVPGDGKNGSHGTDSPEDCLVPCTWM